MTRWLTFASVLAMLTFMWGAEQPGPAHATLACPANPSPPDPADPSMILNVPASGDSVTSPVHVSGLARVFEANVRITVYSASGMVLEDTFTTAAEAGPVLAPFEADVPFTVVTEQSGCIRVWEESAQDGSPRNVVQVEVNLSTGADEPPVPMLFEDPVTPPSTGDAGLTLKTTVSSRAIVLAAVVLFLIDSTLVSVRSAIGRRQRSSASILLSSSVTSKRRLRATSAF